MQLVRSASRGYQIGVAHDWVAPAQGFYLPPCRLCTRTLEVLINVSQFMSHRLAIWGSLHLYFDVCRVDSPLGGLVYESQFAMCRPTILRLVNNAPSTERLDERATITF